MSFYVRCFGESLMNKVSEIYLAQLKKEKGSAKINK